MYSLKSSTWLRLITHHKSKCIHIKSREIRLRSIWLCGKSHIQRQHSFFLFDRLQEIIESNINIITNTKMLSTSIFCTIFLSFDSSECTFICLSKRFWMQRGTRLFKLIWFWCFVGFLLLFLIELYPVSCLNEESSQHYFFFHFLLAVLAVVGWLGGWLALYMH